MRYSRCRKGAARAGVPRACHRVDGQRSHPERAGGPHRLPDDGALGCIDMGSAYRSIDWKTIVLIVGMLPFSIALERTGGVDLAADGLRA